MAGAKLLDSWTKAGVDGDSATFGAVVTSQIRSAGPANVTMRSLDPAVLTIGGNGRQTVQVPAGGSVINVGQIRSQPEFKLRYSANSNLSAGARGQ